MTTHTPRHAAPVQRKRKNNTAAKAAAFATLSATGVGMIGANIATAAPTSNTVNGVYGTVGSNAINWLMDPTTPAQGMAPDARAFLNRTTNQIVYCALQSTRTPSAGTNGAWDPVGKKYDKPTRLTGPYMGIDDGDYPDAATTRKAAYILNTYGQPAGAGSLNRAAAQQAGIQISAVDLAISKLANGGAENAEHQSPSATVSALADKYMAEAAKYASTSYDLVGSAPASAAEGSTVNITGVGIKDAQGTYVPGITMKFTLAAGDKWADGSTGTKTIESTTAAQTLKAIGNADGVQVTATTSDIPDSGIWFANVQDNYSQDIFIAGQKVSDNLSLSTSYTPTTSSVNPTITTKTSQAEANVNVDLYDTVIGTGFPAGAKVTGKSELFKVNEDGTKGAKVGEAAYTATADNNGRFEVKTNTVKITEKGTYNWVESHDAGQQGTVTWAAATSKFGETTETTLVKLPHNPTITTKASSATAVSGTDLYDTVIGDGFPAGAKVTGQSDLYEVKADGTQGQKVGTGTYTATADSKGHFEVKTTTVKIDKTGTYNWVESHNAGSVGKYDTWPAGTSKFGDKSETTVVTPKTTQPQVTTLTSVKQANGKTALTDTIKVTNGVPGAKVSGKDVLYGPFATKPVEGAVPANAPVAGTVDWEATLDAKGEATIVSKPVTVEKAGYYVWNESLNGGTSGGSTWKDYTGKFGVAEETSLITNVKMKTNTAATGKVGDKLTDTIKVEGTVSQPGTITATLYYMAGAKQDATKDNTAAWAEALKSGKAKAVGSVNVKINKDGTYTTPGILADKEGVYTWAEDFAFADGKKFNVTKPGESHEVTNVEKPKSPPKEGPKEGPKVETDMVNGQDGGNSAGYIGLLAVGAAGAGIYMARRRSVGEN